MLDPLENQRVLVLDDPLDDLALAELEGVGHRRGEVDVPLLAVLALDDLNLGRMSHGKASLLLSSYTTR